MKVAFEKQEKNTVHFNIEFGVDEFEKAVNDAYLNNRGKFNIPGFRKGKIPKKIIDLNYGEDFFYEDAINALLSEAYTEAIEELKLEPVDQPHIHLDVINKGEPVVVGLHVDVKPEVKLGSYDSIELEKVEYNVTDIMVDDELKRVQDMNARIIDAGDVPAKEGDSVIFDFEGYIDGEKFDGGSAEQQQLIIGSNSFIPGFEDQMIGKNKGEEFEINVEFPEDYFQEDLRKKSAIFKTIMHEIKKKELPELDDEFAKDVSEFDTLAEYKEDIKKNLEKELAEQEKDDIRSRSVEKVINEAELDIPEAMILAQIDNEMQEFDYRLRAQGLELKQYLELSGTTNEDMIAQFRPMAERRVRGDLVLEAIVKAENIEVSDEDIDAELRRLAKQYNQQDEDKFVADMMNGDLSFIKTGISNTKAMDLLVSKVTFK